MEESGNGMDSSRRENLVAEEVESATRSDMSTGSWRLNVHEFPAMVESKDGEYGFFNLRRLLHTPSKPSSSIINLSLSLSLSLSIYIYIYIYI
jgi:hypothetical protein